VRCYAYQLPKEAYQELEAQILQQLRDGDRDQLRHLLGDHDLTVELLSGEWRLLFGALADYYQFVDLSKRTCRMAVSPSELAEFVNFLRNPERQEKWQSMSFGLAELTDALPVGVDLVGVVFMEESDDWLWAEPVSEIVAIRPEVYELLEPHLRDVMAAGDHAALARLAEDHSESCVEFSAEQWQVLMRHTSERVPELLSVFAGRLSAPGDYTSILEALNQVADPRFQPSLDAWLRVHSRVAQYALYFRDAGLERREFEGSGLLRLEQLSRTGQTQPQSVVPDKLAQPPVARPAIDKEGFEPPSEIATDPNMPAGDRTPQKTIPMNSDDVKRAIERGKKKR
jgi:hypothetical protein